VLVSDNRKLVFVHIQKTGGSTVHRLLEGSISDIYRVGARHQFAIRGMNEIEGWEEYFKFAFVRNPWDRLVSWYAQIRRAQKEGKRPQNKLWRYVHDNSSNFEEFIYNCTAEIEIDEGVYYSFTYNQLDYVTDKNGNLLVNFIGRLENFEKDVGEVFARIGIELKTVPRKNPSAHKHYSVYYTPETETIVRERFKRDIEYFGYEFVRPHS
jgi:chondroitin 4-sulfotransferase 11